MEKELELARLFKEAGRAHHEAFAEVGGEDPDWPNWYATYLQERLASLLGRPSKPDEIAAELVAADQEHRTSQEKLAWPVSYARHFLSADR